MVLASLIKPLHQVFFIKSETGEEVPSMNKVKHITLYLLNDGKPVDSNAITEWKSIEPTLLVIFV